MDEDRLARARLALAAAVTGVAALWLAAAVLTREWSDAPTSVVVLLVTAAWLTAAVLARTRPSVAVLSVAVAVTWWAPVLGQSTAMWHRAALVHLLLSGDGWAPRTWPARLVVAGGYVCALLVGAWAWAWSATALAAALVAAAACERAAIRPSLLQAAPWRRATVFTGAAFCAPALLAEAGLGRGWASAVLLAYGGVLITVALLVVLAARPAPTLWATDLAVDLRSPPLDLLTGSLATAGGDPAAAGREAVAALEAARRLSERLASREMELTAALTETGQSHERLLSADAREREALRAELDDVAVRQLRAAVELVASALEPEDTSPASGCARRAEAYLRTALADLDALGAGLAPPALLEGTPAALRRLAEACAVPVQVALPDESAAAALPEEVRSCVYYVAAEALTNVVKHASATGVRLEVRVDGQVELLVEDDGIGGPGTDGGTGITGMRERVDRLGGSLTVGRAASGGTTLRVVLALPPHTDCTGGTEAAREQPVPDLEVPGARVRSAW